MLLLTASISIGQTSSNPLQPFVGQKLILVHLGDLTGINIQKQDLATVKGNCDVAVLVRKASLENGKAKLDLEDIGTPSINGAQNQCKKLQSEFLLEITGFTPNDTPESVSASVGQLLFTPELYLTAHGISFELQPGPGNENALSAKLPGPQPDAPKLLLSIDPRYTEEARQEKFQGVAKFKVLIGTDGRVHNPQVSFSVGYGLEENALKVFPMWRFKPASKSGNPVPVYASLEMNFRLY